jgi:hypothetical protein
MASGSCPTPIGAQRSQHSGAIAEKDASLTVLFSVFATAMSRFPSRLKSPGGERSGRVYRRTDRVEDRRLEGAIAVAEQHGNSIDIEAADDQIQRAIPAETDRMHLGGTKAWSDQNRRYCSKSAVAVTQLYFD